MSQVRSSSNLVKEGFSLSWQGAFLKLPPVMSRQPSLQKRLHFPELKKLLDYSKSGGGILVKGIDTDGIPGIILWGTRPCDAMGISQLSSIFNWDYKDEIYNNRLSRVTVLGFSCSKADEYCFCTSVGGNPGGTSGSDILFTRLGDDSDFLAEVLTDKGSVVVSMAPELFEKAGEINKEQYLAEVPVRFNHEEIRQKLESYFESDEWVAQSLKCLGCGACAYVCPTCACFDIQDESHGKSGSTCQMLGFMRIFTFHPTHLRT